MNKIYNIFLIGALTAKPYIFSVRSWEIDKILFIDFFDSFGSTIYIEFSGLNILRILPKINKFINLEWITDRIRFFFDSLITQKLNNCFIYKNYKYQPITWFGIYLYLKNIKIFNYKNNNSLLNYSLFYLLDITVDLYNYIYLKLFFYNFYKFNLHIYTQYDLSYLAIDFLNDYLFLYNNILLNDLLINYNYIFIIGYNLRCELPLLFFKLYTLSQKNLIKIFTFGISFFYKNINKFNFIGLSIKDFYFFFNKLKVLKNNTLILCGSGLLNRFDSYYFYFFFKKISNFYNLYKLNYKFYFIFSNLIDINLLFLGLKNDFKFVTKKYLKNINIFFNFFFFNNEIFYKNFILNKNLFIYIYIGANFLVKTIKYNIILPSTFFFENDNLIINLFGYFNKLKFIYVPEKNIKNLIDIYKLIINLLNQINFFKIKKKKIIYNIFILNKYIIYNFFSNNIKFLKIFFLINYILINTINFFFNFFYKNIKLIYYNNFYIYTLNNFYLINLYSYLSKNLVLAYLRFNNNYIYNIK
jgi:hypothetical protein